ncbi:MAG TPA: YbhB/YbcL family Raf kinase inhibitor-like protein [Verrucomicrobiae bacterium]|nr:YbhB/YbcL family Raf kinase inhibitor-like protein [Verrucomicrobiae bacterium]
MKTIICATVAALGISIAVTAAEQEAAMAQFTLTSPSFRNDQPMPAKHSCEGADASPALKWEGAPASTKSYALICDDPDAPGGSWVHWVIYAIPASTTELPENVAKTDTVAALGNAKQGMTDFGRLGYGGPCPPRGHGVHHYHFRLYALDTELNLSARVSRRQLEAAMKGHIVAETELVGTYRRD